MRWDRCQMYCSFLPCIISFTVDISLRPHANVSLYENEKGLSLGILTLLLLLHTFAITIRIRESLSEVGQFAYCHWRFIAISVHGT